MPEFMEYVKERLTTCCSNLKSFVLMRRKEEDGAEISPGQCEIQCDLSDKRTFFAWQRNHMSNERTFLAWCRTGIALIIFSFVIERFDLLIREMRTLSPHPEVFGHIQRTYYLGLVAFVLGALIIMLAGWRFFYIRKHINVGDTEFSIVPDVFLLLCISVIILMIFLLFIFLL